MPTPYQKKDSEHHRSFNHTLVVPAFVAIILALGWTYLFTHPQTSTQSIEGLVAGATDPAPGRKDILVQAQPLRGSLKEFSIEANSSRTIASVLDSVEARYNFSYAMTELGGTGDYYLTSVFGRESTLTEQWMVTLDGERVLQPLNEAIVSPGETIAIHWERTHLFE